MVKCHLCGDEYSETHIEIHLVGVHGVSGPKEVYSSSILEITNIGGYGSSMTMNAGAQAVPSRMVPSLKGPHSSTRDSCDSAKKLVIYQSWFPNKLRFIVSPLS